MEMLADPATKTCPGDHTDQLLAIPETPGVFFGTGLVEDNWHDSDQSVRTDLLAAGAATLAHLWKDLGHHGTGHTTK